MKQVNIVVCGGTFDHFHKGHRFFLKFAFSLGKKVIIGVTSDIYVQSSKFKVQNSKVIENYKERTKTVESFLKQNGVLDRSEIIEIDDVFGPTFSKDFAIDAIVVSDDTKKGAEIINQKRQELNLIPLKVFIAPSVKSEDGKLVSSERIRNGQINREGKLYVKQIWFKKDLILPENLRKKLKKPFGRLFKDAESLTLSKDSLVITVGDITAKIFNEKFLKQDISIIDFKVARKEKFSSIAELGFSGEEKVITASNPAGHITHDLFSKVLKIFKSDLDKKIILKTEGEDDLAVLPVILAAPLGTIIYYGQPGQGVVKIEVSEKIKENIYALADKFEMLK